MKTQFSRRSLAAIALAATLLSGLNAHALDVPDPPEYEGRSDPHTEGGERYGDEEDTDYTGYPVDPGRPSDLYYDPSAEHRRYSPLYNGSTIGFGLMGGVSRLYGPSFDGKTTAPVLGAFGSTSVVLGVATVIGSVTRAVYEPVIQGEETRLSKWDIHFTTALHPGLFFNLGAGRLGYTLGQFQILAGGHLSANNVESDNPDIDRRFFRPGFHLGLGLDTYLDTPNDGGAFWIGVQYRWNNTAGPRDDDLWRDNWVREHQVFLRLSYRFNGNLFGGTINPDRP